MPRKVTLRDVAKEAAVSLGTASRVINGSTTVSEALRRNVEQAILRIGFQPSAAAQTIKSGSSRTIGILVSDFTVERLGLLIRSAQVEVERAGYGVFIACHENNRQSEEESLRFLMRQRIAGLIHSNCTDRSTSKSGTSLGLAVPTVIYDRDGPKQANAVRVCHAAGARQVMEYLTSLGHKKIGMITGPEFMYPARTRIEGYKDVLKSKGIPFNPAYLSVESFSNSFLDTSAMFCLPDRPTAIILGGTSMLPGALKAIRAHGLRIPEDISLVSSGDSDLARLATPAVTVVHWDFREVGRVCALALLRQLNDKTTSPQQILFETDLIIRDSCAPPCRT